LLTNGGDYLVNDTGGVGCVASCGCRQTVCSYVVSSNVVRVFKSRILSWAGHVARKGDRRGAYMILEGKPESRSLGRPRRRWQDNIKMDLGEVGSGHVLDRSGSGEGRLTGCCEYCNETLGVMRGNFWTG
jgi:hypothetical protein